MFDILDVGHSVSGEIFWDSPLPNMESKLSVSSLLCNVQFRRSSSGVGLLSTL